MKCIESFTYIKQLLRVKRRLPCPYCKIGIGHFKGLDKHWNDIDDVEMGFPEVYYVPDYQCDVCNTSWGEYF